VKQASQEDADMELSIVTFGPRGGFHYTNERVDDDLMGSTDAVTEHGTALMEALNSPDMRTRINGSAVALAAEILSHLQEDVEIILGSEDDFPDDPEELPAEENDWGMGNMLFPTKVFCY